MGQDRLECLFAVMAAGVDGKTRGPHHDPLRDEVEICQDEALRPVHPLCHGVAQKARVGADGGIAQAAALGVGKAAEGKPAQDHAERLDAKRRQNHLYGKAELRIQAGGLEGLKDIAGQNHVCDQARETLLPGLPNQTQAADKEARSHKGKDHKLQFQVLLHGATSPGRQAPGVL